MKNYQRYFVAVLGVLFIAGFITASAYAYPIDLQATSTYTPTITAPAPYVPTIMQQTEPSDYSCPADGVVDGWGTVTPNAFWEYQCLQCVVTPLYTSTAVPTTPPPTTTGTPATATATASPTITPTVQSTLTTSLISFVSYTPASGFPNTLTCSPYYNGLVCNFSFSTPPNRRSVYNGVLTVYASAPVTAYVVSDSYASGDFWYPTHPNIDNQNMGLSVGSYPAVGTSVMTHHSYTRQFLALGNYTLTFAISKADYSSTVGWNGTVYIQPQPVLPTQMPTATPTAIVDGYCGSVDGQEGSPDPAFGWTGIEYGQSACLDLGGFQISILGVDIDIPWLAHLCLQGLYIGEAVIFGVSISLDVILVTIAVAWLLRNMFVS